MEINSILEPVLREHYRYHDRVGKRRIFIDLIIERNFLCEVESHGFPQYYLFRDITLFSRILSPLSDK